MYPEQVVNHCGGTIKAAAELGKTPRTIQLWLEAGYISYWNQCAIAYLTSGKLKANRLHVKAKEK